MRPDKIFWVLQVLVLIALCRAVPGSAQVLQSGECFGQTTGTSAQCAPNPPLGLTNGTNAIGLSFTTNVCSTINTPANWSKIGCISFGTSSAAVFYQTAGAGNASPTFTWTGSSTVTGAEIEMEGALASAQLDTSTTHTGASTTSMTANAITTTAYLDHVIAWYFTDNGATNVTFTSAADMGLMYSQNATSYPMFVTEKRQKILATTGNETGTALSSSNYAAFTIAFKSLTPPAMRVYGNGVGFLFANIATMLINNGDFGYCSNCTIANPCASGGNGAIAKKLNGIYVCN